MDRLPDWLPWRWCLYWLILPNTVAIAMWPIGGPPMGRSIIAAGCLALVLSQARSLLFRRIAVATLTVTLATIYIMDSFNLDAHRIDAIGEFLANARPLASLQYAMGALIFLAAVVLAVRGVAKVHRFGPITHWVAGIAAMLGLAQIDSLATAATSNTYKGLPPAGTPVRSAVLAAAAGQPSAQRHNLVVIVVEALGIPKFAEGQQQFAADWDRAAWKTRYGVSHGTIPYFGSTTNGELRELCGAYANYDSFDFRQADCLPHRFAAQGYDTSAFHAFDGGLFDRVGWWRKLDFGAIHFKSDLLASGVPACGGMWPGACDTGIAQRIHAQLKGARQPQFIYWVTLNSHIPVLSDANPGLGGCEDGTAPLADTTLLRCRLFLVHHHLAAAIDRIAMDPALPPTDFLIVGDHMPPFMQRNERLLFDGYNVPWIYLKAREVGIGPQS